MDGLHMKLIFNPTSFKSPPPNKNGNFSTFFGPFEPQKFDFSYKPMRMPIIAKKGVSIAFLLSAFRSRSIPETPTCRAKKLKVDNLD